MDKKDEKPEDKTEDKTEEKVEDKEEIKESKVFKGDTHPNVVSPVAQPKTAPIILPPGSKFIVIFEAPDGPPAIQTGGFSGIDEMLGFNRRTVNPTFVEQMIIAYVNQQAQANQPHQPKKD